MHGGNRQRANWSDPVACRSVRSLRDPRFAQDAILEVIGRPSSEPIGPAGLITANPKRPRDAPLATLSMVEGHAGAVAFSRTGDPGAGIFRDVTVLKKFGDVPDDLSAL